MRKLLRSLRRSVPVVGAIVAASVSGLSAAASEWRVFRIDGSPPLGEARVTFGADGSLAGSTGCNRFMGRADVENGLLVVSGPLAGTRMACPQEGMMRQENVLMQFFEGRIAMAYHPFRNTLSLSKGETTVVLEPVPVSFGPEIPATHGARDKPAGDPPYLSAFGISGDLNVRSEPSTTAEVRGTVMPGMVLRNTGCRTAAGRQWCEVDLPDGSLKGWAAAEFLETADASLRAGQRLFDASGLVPCAKGTGAPMSNCAFGVARGGGGNATVVVVKPDGVARVLWFESGAFAYTDTSQAGGGFETSAMREGDLNFIRVDDERYEIPDAVIHGG